MDFVKRRGQKLVAFGNIFGVKYLFFTAKLS